VTVALSGTADPLDLIPGDPDLVRQDADDLVAEAGRLAEIGTTAAGRTIPSWEGTAADGYATRRSTEVERVDAVAQVYRWVAETLYCYADVLAWAQRQAAAAVTLYAAAAPAPVTNGRIPNLIGQPLPTKPLDPFGRPIVGPIRPGAYSPADIKAQATTNLDAARDAVAQAEQAAADALDRLVEGMPDGKWHWGGFFAGAWGWLVDTATFVAWDTNLIRGVIDPDGYARDAVAMWDGATGTYRLLTTDPLGAPSVLLDTQGLHDDPGHWWGGYAPDIALTAIGGVGTLSRAISAARAGSRIAEAAAAGARAAETAQTAERITVGRFPWTAEELATATAGDGPVTFQIRGHWNTGQVGDALEYVDSGNATRLDGDLSSTGRVTTQGNLRLLATEAARNERAAAEAVGDTRYDGKHVGHGPDATWTGRPDSSYWLAEDGPVNLSFGPQSLAYPLGFKPTIFQAQMPDGTIVRGSFDWSPE
jgi:hypothetical protein